jgi:hypothetical protein
MAFRATLPTALSQALIAFTIEFDNEFEHRIEHHTGNKGGRGVWLTSMVMWSNFMRLIPAEGVALRAVEANGRITNLFGLQRWGYISVEPADQTVRLKPGGRRAQEVWQPLAAEVEQRWRKRFGDAAIDELRQALSSLADPALPLYLPVLRYADGMRAGHVREAPGAVAEDLAALLSQALLSFTLEYEEGRPFRSRSAPTSFVSWPPMGYRYGSCPPCPACRRRRSQQPSVSFSGMDTPSSSPTPRAVPSA